MPQEPPAHKQLLNRKVRVYRLLRPEIVLSYGVGRCCAIPELHILSLAKFTPNCESWGGKLSDMNVWQEQPNSEQRLQDLRDRDLELSKIALGLQMRSRITSLENENESLRAMQGAWTMSRISKLYFSIPIIKSKIKALPRRIANLIKGPQL
jgi:hypothetical protein